MESYSLTIEDALKLTCGNINSGLTQKQVEKNREKFGINTVSKGKKKSFLMKIIDTVSEPMLLILFTAFIITLGINLGKFFKNGSADFTETLGILFAILLSVSITLIMEGSSERAFNALNKIYEKTLVKVYREGKITFIFQEELVVGDIVFINVGDKIFADGRLFYSNSLTMDESALTGESAPVNKDGQTVLKDGTFLAERVNSVYSGTFVLSGEGKMIVTAVGDNTEIGKIAKELNKEKEISSPLTQKLNKLSKTVTLIGAITALFVTGLSFVRLILSGNLNFSSVQTLFVSCIVLIVASVPEGLPTIVAVSLALNMIKLTKENALIKKMIATETAGAVSVICSDKTGTLTTGKMQVEKVCLSNYCSVPEKVVNINLIENFILNGTAEIEYSGKKAEFHGNATECALLKSIEKNSLQKYEEIKKSYKIIDRKPFDNEKKMMSTTVKKDGIIKELFKGAPEKIIPLTDMSESQKESELSAISKEQKKARRVICFCHSENGNTVYDGYATIIDPIRKEVYKAVAMCRKAGVKIKILTGDNYMTAYSIAKELGISESEKEVITASELENVDDETFEKIINRVSVIARSTPIIKMRVVKSLKKCGEVVAVTGDGINDAPAIKHADVGFAMGKTGSDITKETADIVLLDDSFYTIVKAISFGRNVYQNLQRFIIFQLSVNLSAMLLITVLAILGYETPFNTLQLLWINVIMDGPPALTLGLGTPNYTLMENKPIKRDKSIVSAKMFIKIIFNAVFMTTVIIMQYLFNFLCVREEEKAGTVFSLFILFQLFNAFNSRELGLKSVFAGLKDCKIMAIAFGITFLIHIFIEQVAYRLFCVAPLSFSTWIKIIPVAFLIVIISEAVKFVLKLLKKEPFIFIKTNKKIFGA